MSLRRWAAADDSHPKVKNEDSRQKNQDGLACLSSSLAWRPS